MSSDLRSPPNRQEVAAVGLETALTVSPTLYWAEIRTVDQAMLIQKIGEIAFGVYFQEEAKECGIDAMTHRWFALVDDAGERPFARVSMCIPSGRDLDKANFKTPFHTTGYRNANPYPEFKEQIDALGAHLGLDIPPNWQGRLLDRADTPSPRM
jgi:hypothetical protein